MHLVIRRWSNGYCSWWLFRDRHHQNALMVGNGPQHLADEVAERFAGLATVVREDHPLPAGGLGSLELWNLVRSVREAGLFGSAVQDGKEATK